MDREGMGVVAAASTQIGRLKENCQRGVEPRDESAPGNLLSPAGRPGQIRPRKAGDIYVARLRLNRQGGDAATAHEGGLNKGRKRGVQARNESAFTARLRPARRAGEIRRGSITGDVHVARCGMDRE